MVAAGVLPRLMVLMGATSPPALQAAALRLANNQAFETKLRRQMVAAGLVQRLSDVLMAAQAGTQAQAAATTQITGASSQLQPLALGLLYMSSMEQPVRSTLAAGDLLPRYARGALSLVLTEGRLMQNPCRSPQCTCTSLAT